MFQTLNMNKPNSLINKFNAMISDHNHSTRYKNNFKLPQFYKTTCQRSILFAGPKQWDSLPLSIKNLENLNNYKCKLKNYFINSY